MDSKEDIKQAVDNAGDNINLQVSDQNGAVVNFKIKKTTPLRKLMNAYCGRQGLSLEAVRFTFDGTRLRPEDAPRDHGMEDGDSMEVFQEQQGG